MLTYTNVGHRMFRRIYERLVEEGVSMSTLPAVKKIRDEYPRPQFARDFWVNLNGEWNFRFDDEDVGVREQWYNRESAWFTDSILVPFCFQSELSGIHD